MGRKEKQCDQVKTLICQFKKMYINSKSNIKHLLDMQVYGPFLDIRHKYSPALTCDLTVKNKKMLYINLTERGKCPFLEKKKN